MNYDLYFVVILKLCQQIKYTVFKPGEGKLDFHIKRLCPITKTIYVTYMNKSQLLIQI